MGRAKELQTGLSISMQSELVVSIQLIAAVGTLGSRGVGDVLHTVE